jgi:cytochrome c
MFLMGVASIASDHAPPAAAKAMLEKAIDHYRSVGRQQALADFTAKKPPFRDRDLYVLCFDANRVVVANGGFPWFLHTPGDTVVDQKGKGVATAAWAATTATGEGQVHYRWYNPATHNVETKLAFFERIGHDVCGVGAYSEE